MKPRRWKTLPRGVRCQDFDGQKILGPMSETMAGTSVTAAIAMTSTPMARPGPRLRKPPNTASRRAYPHLEDLTGRRIEVSARTGDYPLAPGETKAATTTSPSFGQRAPSVKNGSRPGSASSARIRCSSSHG
jgi:hypothetical protein